MKRTPTCPALAFFALGTVLAVSSPTTLGQSCSVQPVLQGRVCTKPGARCSPPTVGSGNVGQCTTEGMRPEATCAVSGATHPAPSCLNPASATVTGGAATSLLTVSANSSTEEGTYTVTVSAVDGHGRPPDNGAQSATVAVSHVRWILMGGGRIAFLTFVALLVFWSARLLWRAKIDALR